MKRRRIHQRGASLVEAVAVIPVFILFSVGMIYMHRLYTHELAVESSARASTMAYALGGCQGDFATVVHANDGSLTAAPPSGVGDPGDIQPQDGNGQLMMQQGGETVATLKHTSSTVQTTFDPGQTFPTATKTTHSTSTAMCDEVPQKGDLPGLINYAIHLFVP